MNAGSARFVNGVLDAYARRARTAVAVAHSRRQLADRENPHAGGAELHSARSVLPHPAHRHDVDLCAAGLTAHRHNNADGITSIVSDRPLQLPVHAHRAYVRLEAARKYDVVVEDLNKVPPFHHALAPRGARRLTHLSWTTAFREDRFPSPRRTWLPNAHYVHVSRCHFKR